MWRRKWKWLLGTAVFLVCCVATGAWIFRPDPDALFKLMNDNCLSSEAGREPRQPCVVIDRGHGFAVLKDRKGSDHFLLLPTQRMRGIEDGALLGAAAINYFEYAWEARGLLSNGKAQHIPDASIALAVNSEGGRTQNQLHIHLSCLKPDIQQRLREVGPLVGRDWHLLPESLEGHVYYARRVDAEAFGRDGAFRMLATGIEGAADNMGEFGLAATSFGDGSMLLLATRRDLSTLNFASPEELQDTDCSVQPPA